MLTYLIILLDDTCTSYCHYEVNQKGRRLICLEDLKAGVKFAMKENLNVQFVYPNYELPEEYLEVIDSIDHTDIKPITLGDEADVLVQNGWEGCVPKGSTCIIHSTRKQLAEHLSTIREWLVVVERLNVVLTDIVEFNNADIESYKATLDSLTDIVFEHYQQGKTIQLNLLTDRLILDKMNNCNAGEQSITMAPNGIFYLCPAFYYEDELQSVGDLNTGLDIKNPQLLHIDHAPICRACDAYQCRRCVWMNGRLTGDMNTPSYQQCVLAHLERNAARSLQQKMEKAGIHIEHSKQIEEIDYIDPFNIVNKWK